MTHFFCIFESLIQFNNIFCWYSAYSKKHQYIYLVHNGIGSPLKWADLGKPLSFSLCVPNPNICFARARARENTNILFDQTDFHFHFKYWWLVCPTPIYASLVQEEKEKTLTFSLIKQIFTFTLNTDDLCAQTKYMVRSCRKRKRKH